MTLILFAMLRNHQYIDKSFNNMTSVLLVCVRNPVYDFIEAETCRFYWYIWRYVLTRLDAFCGPKDNTMVWT